ATSFFCNAATVQPQEVRGADLKWIGASPLFWYLKTPTAVASPTVGCNSISVFSQTSSACAVTPPRMIAINKMPLRIFILQGKRNWVPLSTGTSDDRLGDGPIYWSA